MLGVDGSGLRNLELRVLGSGLGFCGVSVSVGGKRGLGFWTYNLNSELLGCEDEGLGDLGLGVLGSGFGA